MRRLYVRDRAIDIEVCPRSPKCVRAPALVPAATVGVLASPATHTEPGMTQPATIRMEDLEEQRLGFGAMQLPERGVWGEPSALAWILAHSPSLVPIAGNRSSQAGRRPRYPIPPWRPNSAWTERSGRFYVGLLR